MQESFIVKTIRRSRLEELAKPKPAAKGFVEDRRSVYWVDKLPPQPPTVFDISPRLEKLIPERQFHTKFVPDRPSPIWPVSKAAQRCKERERSITLSHPRLFSKDFVPDRTPPYEVSKAAKKAVPSERIQALAQPKYKHLPLPDIDSTWRCYEPVCRKALNYVASERIEEIALPKQLPAGFEYDRSVFYHPKPGVLTNQASERSAALAKPRIRKSLNEGYDPFLVSVAARTAVASPRLNVLSQPTPKQLQSVGSRKLAQ